MTAAPKRIRLSRKKGWHMPPGTINVDRTTRYGNPFIPGTPNMLGWGNVRDTDHAIWLYRQWLTTPARSIIHNTTAHHDLITHLPALAGHDLACWCPAGSPCHADVLLEIANRPDIVEVSQLLLAWTAPPSAVELAIATGQLGRVMGYTPAEAGRLGSTVVELVATERTRVTTQEAHR